MTARRRAAGFTLIEIAVSLAILGVGMVAIIQAFGGGLRLQGRASRQDRAVELARSAMDRLIEDPRTRSGSDDAGDGYRVDWTTRTANAEDGIEQDEDESDVEMRYLEVGVTWRDGAGEKTYALRSLQPSTRDE
jgi:prepilin-type N-terminal cleavage/methylation domain-containing protein